MNWFQIASRKLALPSSMIALLLAVLGSCARPLLAREDESPVSPPIPDGSATIIKSRLPLAQASSGSATTNQQSPTQDNTQHNNQHLHVNPLTGLVSASESDYRPLTGHERWKLYFTMNYWSYGAYFGPFFAALVLDQSTGSPSQWGGGFAGYGRRVASRTATAIVQGTVQAPLAAILHEDVRYIGSSQQGTKRRVWHAVAYSFLTYNDQGRPTLNLANLGAYYCFRCYFHRLDSWQVQPGRIHFQQGKRAGCTDRPD